MRRNLLARKVFVLLSVAALHAYFDADREDDIFVDKLRLGEISITKRENKNLVWFSSPFVFFPFCKI